MALYVAGYVWHRSANSVMLVTNSLPSTNSYPRFRNLVPTNIPRQTNFGTQVLGGPVTTDSDLRYCLFYLYWPLGRFERLIEGRDYVLVDSSKPGTIRDVR